MEKILFEAAPEMEGERIDYTVKKLYSEDY